MTRWRPGEADIEQLLANQALQLVTGTGADGRPALHSTAHPPKPPTHQFWRARCRRTSRPSPARPPSCTPHRVFTRPCSAENRRNARPLELPSRSQYSIKPSNGAATTSARSTSSNSGGNPIARIPKIDARTSSAASRWRPHRARPASWLPPRRSGPAPRGR